jgi:hypothetical protein
LRHHVGVTWWRRGRRAAEEPQARLAAVRAAATEAAGGSWQAVERLIDVLADLDATGDEATGRAALGLFVGMPAVVLRLDEYARRAPWYHRETPVANRLAERVTEGAARPIAVALSSSHRDGRVRERAVVALLARPCPELVPFLVLRTAEWAAPVRNRARAGLALLLAGGPGGHLLAALPMALAVQGRLRGGFAHGQVLAALLSAPAEVRPALADSPDPVLRRFLFGVASAQGWLRPDDLVAAAESETDVRIRGRAAEAACREAVWGNRVTTLRRLAGNRRPGVRALALTGLVRLGHDSEVAGYLDDAAELVRAVARDAARRAGVDASHHYRAAVAEPVPVTGAIAGLAETGSLRDAPLLRPLLAHPSAKVRAHAVRALRRLDGVEPDEIVPLLRDPSPGVVREATAALRPYSARVPDELAWELLSDPRVEVRRAGYRLLCVRPTDVRVRAARLIAVDPDPRLATRGRADLAGLTRHRDHAR